MQEVLYVFIPIKGDLTGLDILDLKERYHDVKVFTFDERLNIDHAEMILIPKKFQMIHHKQFWIRDYILTTPEGTFRAGFKKKDANTYPPILTKIFEKKLSNYPVRVDGGEIVKYEDRYLTSSLEYYELNKHKVKIDYIELQKDILCFYHLDLLVNIVNEKKVLMSNPFVLDYYSKRDFDQKAFLKDEFKKLKNRLEELGFEEIIHIPMTLRENISNEIILEKDSILEKENIKVPMNSIVNGVWSNKYFYYSWMDISENELKKNLKEYLKALKDISLRKVELHNTLYDKAGGLRCLSCEIKV